ncbi:SIS domain-containing protein [Yinghuangia seranimata]|uniref:SIS domain-containing protein n=1 Tax=Yinghuangia seranimata TaxID=408067 RepID=UPI00248B49E4|nr:SIS domain-containing protein [Yinghuangia seranimata]MDI2131204.1 SIS domain-containing protein [Yinghuangia seranimata]
MTPSQTTDGPAVGAGHTVAEIATQPDLWARAAALATDKDNPPEGLPAPGERVAVVGCGTSWFIAQAYAVLREQAGHGWTDALAASEYPHTRGYDRVVALTRSGTTTEVLDLLDRLRGSVPTTVITGSPGTPGVTAADHAILLDWADEQSVVQTRFATTALALLRAHLGEDLTAAIRDAAVAVTDPLPEALLAAEQFTFLGTGWTVGLAAEAALKMREANGAWTEHYPAMEYRHGPISIAAPGRVTWIFGPVPEGLATDIAPTGAHLVSNPGDPMADLIRAQRLAAAVAYARNLDPDRPRNLTRSVVLDQG